MKKLVLSILAAGTALAAAAPANAAIFIGVSVNGGAITQVATDGGTGSANYNTTVGGFVYNVGAQGFPLLPRPNLLSQSVNISTGNSGTVDIYVTQTDQTQIPTLVSSFTSNAITGASATIMSYVDANNGLFGGTLLQSATFNGAGTYQGVNNLGAGSFSETVRYSLTFTGGAGSNFNGTANLSAVPEPATWGMMMLGFGAMGFALRRRRNVETRIRFA